MAVASTDADACDDEPAAGTGDISTGIEESEEEANSE
jgi:hypothetical protein